MNKTELREKYTDAPACGVWSDGLVGIELLDMLYDIEDSATVRGYKGDLHRVKVYYTDTSAYIRLYGRRYYFRDCVRV